VAHFRVFYPPPPIAPFRFTLLRAAPSSVLFSSTRPVTFPPICAPIDLIRRTPRSRFKDSPCFSLPLHRVFLHRVFMSLPYGPRRIFRASLSRAHHNLLPTLTIHSSPTYFLCSNTLFPVLIGMTVFPLSSHRAFYPSSYISPQKPLAD